MRPERAAGSVVAAVVAVLMLAGLAGCSSDGDAAEGTGAGDAARSTTSTTVDPADGHHPDDGHGHEPHEVDPAVFLTVEEVGLPAADSDDPYAASMLERDQLVEALAEQGYDATYPSGAYDGAVEDFEPLATGTAAAEMIADFVTGNADPTGCWTEDPPVVMAQGSASFSGASGAIYQGAKRFATEADAQAFFDAARSGNGLSSTDSGDNRLVATSGDETTSSFPCGGLFYAGTYEVCGPSCLTYSGTEFEQTTVTTMALDGEWVIEVTGSDAAEVDRLLALVLERI